MATSGTVSTTVFHTRKLVDHAYRRCGIPETLITAQRIETAFDLLYLRLSAMANKGMPLWAIQKDILPLYEGQQSISTPLGTVELLNCNLRKLDRFSGTASASEGTAENAFDGDLDTACTQALAAGDI